MTDPEPQPEELPAKVVEELNRSLKSCQKVVSNYRSALLKKPVAGTEPPKDD